MVDAPETVFNVALDQPLITSGRVDQVPHFLDGVLRSAPGPETIRGRAEVRLEDRLQHEHQRHLHDPVAEARDAELAHLPRPALGDRTLAHRQRRVAAIPERLAKLVQELLHTLPLDALARDAINAGGTRPPVTFHPLPGDEQRCRVADKVEEIAEALLLVLACPAVQLGLPSQYPPLRPLGVEQRGRIHARPPERLLRLPACCPPSPCTGLSPARTTTRTPPRPGSVSRHRALPDRHQRPGAPEALPTFTVIRSTGSAVGSTPAAHPGSSRSVSPAITHRSEPARSDLPSSRARSLLRPAHVRQIWGWSANRGASITALRSLCLSVSLARTRASGSTARPSRCQGCSHRLVRDPAPRLPPASPRRCIGAGPASQPARTEMSLALIHLLSHSASWRTEEVAGDEAAGLRPALRLPHRRHPRQHPRRPHPGTR